MCVHNEKERSGVFFGGGGHKSFDKRNKTEPKMFPTSKTEISPISHFETIQKLNILPFA